MIVSLENHCSVRQQIAMATHLKALLGERLLTDAVDQTRQQMPSPSDLRGKVIIKVSAGGEVTKSVGRKSEVGVSKIALVGGGGGRVWSGACSPMMFSVGEKVIIWKALWIDVIVKVSVRDGLVKRAQGVRERESSGARYLLGKREL